MKAIAVAILLGLFAENAPPQTEPHTPSKMVSEKDLDTLDYCLWFLRAQYWIDHPDTAYGKEFSKQLNLNPADEAAFRSIVGDFNKRHEQLLAEHYRKIKNREWTPETETQLIGDLVAATNDTIARIKTNLSAAGAMKVDNLMLHGGQGSVFETS
jgi:hypothetical protein